jgi:glycosyltransferase involved in cell wall biosynthesis
MWSQGLKNARPIIAAIGGVPIYATYKHQNAPVHNSVTKGKKDDVMMFHIGTNNWQRQGEFAPGSGILHASFHQTFNNMNGVKCYSIYPSKVQTDPVPEVDYDPTFRIFKLNHDIPICESVSPNSSYRWHSMNDEQFAAYRKRLEDEVCAFMDEIEKREGKKFDYLISHHAFTNAMTGGQILQRRRADGNKKLKHFNFVHGTALKMYIKEKEGDKEYPMRFLTYTQKHGVFNGTESCQGIWVNSRDYIGKFLDCFPTYPKDRTVYSQIGVNQNTFRPKGTSVEKDLAQHIREADKPRLKDVKRIVTFVGKFADWKRLDAVLYAAAIYEKDYPDLGTIIVGSGPPEAIAEYEGLAKKLGLKRTFFVGPKGQPILADLFSMSEVGLFPSWKEPFGMVFVECMACGCPTIGAKSGGPTEFVKAAQGLLVEEEDDWRTEAGIKRLAAKVAAAVETALRENWKEKKGKGCSKFVEEEFSTTAQCSAMLADMKRWN